MSTMRVIKTLEMEVEVPLPPTDLPETDGEPLESDWHRIEISLLVDSVFCHLAPRTDFYAGGNMFVYFSEQQVRNRDYRGPDFFFVKNVSSTPTRRFWAAWKEGGRYPDAIIELLSPSTANEDRTVKKKLYERVLHIRDYFCYDPDTRTLEGWRLDADGYEPLALDPAGRLWCKELGLWLGLWEGMYQGHHNTWLRFFTPEGKLVLVFAETAQQRAEAEKQQAEVERQRAEAEKQQAEVERQRAEAEKQQAEVERQRADAMQQRADAMQQRADAAEAELVQLRAELARQKREKPSEPGT
jgi:Uma2 family endonuclease